MIFGVCPRRWHAEYALKADIEVVMAVAQKPTFLG